MLCIDYKFYKFLDPVIYCLHCLIIMQDLPEGQGTSEHSVTEQVEQLSLSPAQQHEIQRIRDELRYCALYSGVAVIDDNIVNEWVHIKQRLSSSGYKVISLDTVSLRHHDHPRHFTAIAQSITYPKPPTAAESSYSPPFVIAVFVSGAVQSAHHTLVTHYGEVNIVNDIIQPFLPQSAPHLQYIPKLFFITAWGDPQAQAPPPHFPDDPDGNYCIAYHVAEIMSYMDKWAKHISDNVFLPGITVQEAIENSRSHLEGGECLHYFTYLRNKLVLNTFEF